MVEANSAWFSTNESRAFRLHHPIGTYDIFIHFSSNVAYVNRIPGYLRILFNVAPSTYK